LGAVVAAVSACTGEVTGAGKAEATSCNTDTKQLKVSLSAQADSSATRFFAAVFKDGVGSLALDCGDAFAVIPAAGGGASSRVALEREPTPAGVVHYIGSVPADPGGGAFVFSFERASGAAAPASHAYVPAVFTVPEVTPTVNIAAGEAFKFRIDPPMAVDAPSVTPTTVRLRIMVAGSCLEQQTYTWTPKVLFPPVVTADGQ
jgi:hypothetical protein